MSCFLVVFVAVRSLILSFIQFVMVSNKLMAVAFAALASLAVVDAGVCIPHGTTTISSASATEASSTTAATSTSVTIETDSTTTSGTVSSAETSSTTAETLSGTTSASSVETTSTAAESSSTLTTLTTIATTSTTVETSSGTTSAQTTSTTAEVVPTNLVTNPEFNDGLQPWQAIPYPDQDLFLTDDSYKTEKAARLYFESKSGSPFTNYLYHRIDKSLLKAGSYALEGFVKVDSPGDEGEGCTRAVAACLVGPIGLTEAILNVGVLPATFAESRWAKISTICDVTEEKLEEIDDFGVAIGFECFNTNAYLDSVSFKAVEIVIE
ncbi:hypothetical protein B0J15DRAFT_477124 [Fusarium solani]|uniref:Uncharacterized protein n=1 Tax=Fusarium solani TaxID=169388 RepID=A0A9P9RC62_FUSSL|nr:uncharacterized protein B0J15DRAFT_477124 [Fusarium solani]KAH7273429.1 hypothetical protein B0J15DRAFT_477124 [Fusarium solani]